MEYQIKNIFIEKSWRKCAAKASPSPDRHCMQKILLKVKSFETGFSKILINGIIINPLFFLLNPVPLNRQLSKTKGAWNE